MKTSHDKAREAMTAMACGTASADQIDALERHVAECSECAHWRKQLQVLVTGLGELIEPVPQRLDQTVRDLVHHGLQEDPWLIIWEAACEVAEVSQPRRSEAALASAEAVREAAELTEATASPPAEAVVRQQFHRVERIEATGGTIVILAAPTPATWVGVVLSAESVPMKQVEVRWTAADGRIHQTTTDGRGSFIIGGPGHPPMSVAIGKPAIAEHQFS